ncbi:shikimate dehydrogenase [Rhodopila sp.]|uniref:shikimate dehydrogenase n=1 Tax=Rhodopila sp. TaxID=2480087 RepID=UPI003D123C78
MQPCYLIGLIGSGIQASLTPAMHMQEADALGFRYLYRLIDLTALGLPADALPDLLTAAERMGFNGLNITHPCKQLVLPLLDQLSDDARAIGAVNTVVLTHGKRIGHNTDASGFAAAFRRGLPDAALDRVVQFGAGGAGCAVAHAALGLGVGQLTLVDTDPLRAAALAHSLCARFGANRAVAAADSTAAVAAADGLINATPMGMAKYPGQAVPDAMLQSNHWVADIVYFPLETALLATARAKRCRVLHGGGMAVFQAVEAFRLFTGTAPRADRMLAHFDQLTASP